MATGTLPTEEIIPLTLDGYAYTGRVVYQPNASLAPVVFIGGAFQQQDAWGRMEWGCLEAATMISVDLPSWGNADRLPAEYDFGFLSAALAQLVDKVTPAPVNLVGASYGSPVAYQWACDYPERVERLALVGAASDLPAATRAFFGESVGLAEQGEMALFAQRVLDGMVCRTPGRTVKRQTAVVRYVSRMLHSLSTAELVKVCDNTRRLLDHMPPLEGPPVRMPVLVAVGEHDNVTPPSLGRELAAACLDARFITLEEADHLVHLERPDELLDLLLRFFGGESLDGLDYCSSVEYLTAQ